MIVALIIFILVIVVIFVICIVGGNGDTEGEDGTQGGGILHHPSGKENEDKEVDDSRLSD